MKIDEKYVRKIRIYKITLLILLCSTAFMLTACDDDDYEEDDVTMVMGSEQPVQKERQKDDAISSELMASIIEGEGIVGVRTDDQELGTGYKTAEGTEHYDPDNPFKITRDARPIRRIEKQDVYGNILTDDFYFYRNNLSKSEKNLYDQIYANAVELDPYFTMTSKVSIYRVNDIMDAVRFDNPDLFWLSTEFGYTYDDNGNVTSFTLEFYEMADNLEAYKEQFYNCADSVLEQVMDFEYDVDKVKYIHDFLININDYEFGPLEQSAYSAICVGKTVCAGYTHGFHYFMQRLGIPSAAILGDAGGRHAWSMVLLDGEYYEVDVTWDDPAGNEPGVYYYDYFNITSDKMGRVREEQSMAIPQANGQHYSFGNWYGSDPGRSFSDITYGEPKTSLPHLYPGEGNQNYQSNQNTVVAKDDKVEEVQNTKPNDGGMSDRDKTEIMIAEWSDDEWDEFWDELSEYLTDEELVEVDEMEWDEFIDMMTAIYYE